MNVLIIVDMQNDFINGSLAIPTGDVVTNKIANFCNGFYGMKIFTQDTHHEDYFDTLEGKKLPVEHCIAFTEGWNIVNKLKSYTDKIFTKNTFTCEDMIKFLKTNKEINDNVDEIYICGVCTSICVVSNALALRAAFPNMKITCLENLCDDVTLKKHNAGIEVMKSCHIDIKTVKGV